MASDDTVEVKFGASTSEAEAGISQVGTKLTELEGPARELAEGFGLLRRTFIEAFAVDEIAEFVSHMSELGEQAIRTSEMLGISVEQVQELGFAAKMVGGDSETTATALTRLERNMAEAQDGASKAARAFEALGISQDDIKNKSPEQVLGLIANAFKGAEDGAAKTAIAMDLMGRGGAQLIPLLNQGSEGLEKMGVVAQQTGSVLTELQAEGLEKTAQGITTLKASVEGAGISVLEIFKPAIDAAIGGLTSLVQYLGAAAQMVRVVADLIEGGLAIALAATIEKFEELGIRVANVFETIVLKVREVASVLDELAQGHLQAAVDAQVAGEQKIAQATASATKEIQGLGKQYDDLKTKIENATLAALSYGTAEQKDQKTQLTAPTTGGGKDDNSAEQNEIAIEKSDLATNLELYKLDVAAKKDADDQKVASGQQSKQAELSELISLVGKEKEVALQEIADERDLYDSDSAAWEQLNNKKLVTAAQYNNEILKLTAQSATEQKKEYDTLFQSIERASQTAVDGVLAGTQTWQAALQRTFSNILSAFVDDLVVKRVTKWLEGEALMLTGTQAKNAGVVTSDAAANDASLAGMAIKAIKTLTSDAAQAFGGVFAFLAPEMGPAAAGPAAGASAAVLAAASSIPSFDVGSWSIPQDTLAMVHQGEMIIPAQQAANIRGGTGGGASQGDNYTINFQVSAVDTQSGASFLKNNSAVIAQMISSQIRNANTSLRGSMR